MQLKLEILEKGDTVLNVWDSHIAVEKASGEVMIFQYYLDKENLPRLSEHVVLITYGKGTISAKVDDVSGNSIEFGTF